MESYPPDTINVLPSIFIMPNVVHSSPEFGAEALRKMDPSHMQPRSNCSDLSGDKMPRALAPVEIDC